MRATETLRNDPNKGSNFGWYALIVLVLLAFALVFLVGPLCPQPESWRNFKNPSDATDGAGGDARP